MKSLWYKLTHRTYTRNVCTPNADGHSNDYMDIEFTTTVFDTVSEHVMFHWLNMNYYWSYTKGWGNHGFSKIWDLDTLLDGK